MKDKNENLADTFVKARESLQKDDLKVEDFEPFQRTVQTAGDPDQKVFINTMDALSPRVPSQMTQRTGLVSRGEMRVTKGKNFQGKTLTSDFYKTKEVEAPRSNYIYTEGHFNSAM